VSGKHRPPTYAPPVLWFVEQPMGCGRRVSFHQLRTWRRLGLGRDGPPRPAFSVIEWLYSLSPHAGAPWSASPMVVLLREQTL
jgi:hypothetical protein